MENILTSIPAHPKNLTSAPLETVVALGEIDVGREDDWKYNRRHYADIRGRQ